MSSIQQSSPGWVAAAASKLLFDLGGVDFSARLHDRESLRRWNPQRGDMAMLDAIVWESAGYERGLALKHIRADEFWVPGHFPKKPIFPAVLQIESAAQLACYLYNSRKPEPSLAAFLRIENAAFRHMVVPGDDLYILCREVKYNRRRFISDVQGVVNGNIAFEARITGMEIGGKEEFDLDI